MEKLIKYWYIVVIRWKIFIISYISHFSSTQVDFTDISSDRRVHDLILSYL